ncbi:MAG: family oxidoreductase [Conexibacter sp.]|nr:family oxidoreductase [Conexibacter sp.]
MTRDGARADIVIVGAGPSGAVAAKRFLEAGLSVVCLEQGDWPDYTRARAGFPDFELVARKDFNWDPNARVRPGDYPIDDRASDVTALMFNGVGGSAVMYAAHWERFLPSDFRVRTLDGVGDDWPITYEELEPYYVEVEKQFAVSGLDGNPALPPGEGPPLPPVPLNQVGRLGAKALNELGWHWWPGANAIATRDYGRLHACVQRAACPFGCPTGAKASPDRTHWPDLVAAGARLVVRAAVTRITTRADGLADGVCWVDADGEEHFQPAGAVVVCANGIGTPRLLLQSDLANSSGLVGRRLMMHPFGNAIGVFDEDLESWRGPLGQYLHSLQFYETDTARGFVRGAKWNLLPSGAPLSMMLPGLWGDDVAWGPEFHRQLRARLGHSVVWTVICEDLPDPDNRVVLDDDGHGVRLEYRTSENSRRMLDFHLARLDEVLTAMGAVERRLSGGIRESGWHIMGTARMGDDPETSVVDRHGRAHDVANLYVFDGSVFPTSSGMNPTATIAANALRCADALVAARREQPVAA